MVVKLMAERWSTGVRTRGCQSTTAVRRVARDEGGARGALGWARGGRSALVNDELTGEEAAGAEVLRPGRYPSARA
jgi:hypothetical protein